MNASDLENSETTMSNYHATCKRTTGTWLGETVRTDCDVDTDDPTLFESHLTEYHGGGTRKFVNPSNMRVELPRYRKIKPTGRPTLTSLTKEEREWLGRWVQVAWNCRGQVWCLGSRKGELWIACEDGQLRRAHVSALTFLATAQAG